MKKCLVLVLLAVLPLCAQAELKQGPVKLNQIRDSLDEGKMFHVDIGKNIKVEARFYVQNLFGRTMVNANARLTNKASSTMHFAYFASFYDKNRNLLGSCSQHSYSGGIQAGNVMSFGSCLISLPADAISKIAWYQLRFYEGDKRIGR